MAKLKRLRAPKFWKVEKKAKTWVVAPHPGPHKKFECIPLLILVRDILKITENASETKAIINRGELIVDGKVRKDYKYPAGLMDVITIPKLEKFYRIVPYEKGLKVIEISEMESKEKILKVKNKILLKGKKVQLNLHDGRNMLVEKDIYKTGDSLLVELPSNKILKHVKLEAGNTALIVKGKNAGDIVKIKELVVKKSKELDKVVCEMDNKKLEVIQEYILVVGEETPIIKVVE